jgi:RNase P/RNase MRP subunit POP5
MLISAALTQLYGVVGAARLGADVAAYDAATGKATVEFAAGQAQYVRAALAAVTSHQGARVSVTVDK